MMRSLSKWQSREVWQWQLPLQFHDVQHVFMSFSTEESQEVHAIHGLTSWSHSRADETMELHVVVPLNGFYPLRIPFPRNGCLVNSLLFCNHASNCHTWNSNSNLQLFNVARLVKKGQIDVLPINTVQQINLFCN